MSRINIKSVFEDFEEKEEEDEDEGSDGDITKGLFEGFEQEIEEIDDEEGVASVFEKFEEEGQEQEEEEELEVGGLIMPWMSSGSRLSGPCAERDRDSVTVSMPESDLCCNNTLSHTTTLINPFSSTASTSSVLSSTSPDPKLPTMPLQKTLQTSFRRFKRLINDRILYLFFLEKLCELGHVAAAIEAVAPSGFNPHLKYYLESEWAWQRIHLFGLVVGSGGWGR